MPAPAATVGSYHTCPLYDGDTPHTGGPALSGSSSVFIEGQPACCAGDPLECATGGPDTIAGGSISVFINGKAAARSGDPTAHGGKIEQGAGTVFLG